MNFENLCVNPVKMFSEQLSRVFDLVEFDQLPW